MGRGAWSTVRRVVGCLLMLATLLVFAVPSHASLRPHQHAPVLYGQAVVDTSDDGAAGLAVHEHTQNPCKEPGLLGDGDCCSAAHCATMHGGLPVEAAAAFVPALGRADHRMALATLEGIDSDLALRPPL